MFISIVLNTEYMDIASRKMWYLKNLLHCKDNGWILITHEYMKTHFEEIQNAIQPSLFDSWEMRPFTAEEVKDVEQYYIPDELFLKGEKSASSRTNYLINQYSSVDDSLYLCLDQIIKQIKNKHHDCKIEGIFNCLESFECVRKIGVSYDVPVISYVFSALRKPHGYQFTLFSANFGHLFAANDCEKRWADFQRENGNVPVLLNEELIALLGKERTLPLLPLLYQDGPLELNVCGDCFSILPNVFPTYRCTDDDIYYEASKYYTKEQIGSRQHPIHLDTIQVPRLSVHNDPAAWILKSKRMAAVCSQIVLKAALWNRTVIMPENILPFSFMCEKDICSNNKMSLSFLNYYIFGYLIPGDLMFNDAYWKWRLNGPSEVEVYQYHLNYYEQKLGVDSTFWNEDGDCLRRLLAIRGIDNAEQKEILSPVKHSVDYDVAIAKFVVDGKSYWRLNTLDNGKIISRLVLNIGKTEKCNILFYPIDDADLCVCIDKVLINNVEVVIEGQKQFKYLKKTKGHYCIDNVMTDEKETVVEISWRYLKPQDMLDSLAI